MATHHSHPKTHIDIQDRHDRQEAAQSLGVSEDRLKKAVRLVGTRLASVRAYFSK